jgi:hypothetical protein
MIDRETMPCKECGWCTNDRHKPTCSSATDEQKIEDAPRYFEYWGNALKELASLRDRLNGILKRKDEQTTLWHGKYLIVTRENNALRKKLRQQSPLPPATRKD